MISFIIPAYNAEKTIERAINSILNQKQSNLDYEVVVINDGSKDHLDDIMKKFQKNEKINYYIKKNTGVADTRNYGVSKAKGDYIIFVDCDDYISDTLLNDIEPYINDGVDLIKWQAVLVDENQNELSRPDVVHFDKTKGEEGFNLLFGKDILIDCLWNYAIKKNIMLEFPKGTYHEDFAIMPLIILKAKNFVAIDKYEYYYVQSKNSIMRTLNKDKTRIKLKDKLNHFDNLLKKVGCMNIRNFTKENVAIFATNSLLATIKDLNDENKTFFEKELKARNISRYIKPRNLKQIIKKIHLSIKY